MNPLNFREIPYGSAEYLLECGLRDEVLRKPLGMKLADEDLSAEAGQRHFGCFDGETLLACVIAAPLADGVVKLRQMAVSPKAQGRGIGRLLLENLEAELVSRGCRRITLHARVSALGFYSKLGFVAEDEEFLEVGLSHRRMHKSLQVSE